MQSNKSYNTPIHESAVLLTWRLLLLQLLIGLLAILSIAGLLLVFNNTLVDTTPLIASLSVTSILLQTFDAVMVLFIVLRWAHTIYIITPKEVVIRQGIAKISEITYELGSITEVELEQDIFGRLFNYGTVSFRSNSLKGKVRLVNIPQPEQYKDMLRSAANAQRADA